MPVAGSPGSVWSGGWPWRQRPAVGESLAAYAQRSVSGEIKRHFRDRRWQVRVPRAAQEQRLVIRAARAELAQRLARDPSDADLARYLEVPPRDIAAAQLASRAIGSVSLDAPAGAGDSQAGATLGDSIGAEDPRLERVVVMDAVWQSWAPCPPASSA